MKDHLEKIYSTYLEFVANAEKAVNGNKSAGVRSRKLSLDMTALLKDWRVVSNPESVKK